MPENLGTGEVYISIELQTGGQTKYALVKNDTGGAVVYEETEDGFKLTAKKGSYTFYYLALNFDFGIDAVLWESEFHFNLAWIRPTEDKRKVAMSNLNFVGFDQTVDFLLIPSDDFSGLFRRPIDPTILNLPEPPTVLAVEDFKESVAA